MAEPSQPSHTTQGFMTRPTLLEEDGLVLGLTMESCHSSPVYWDVQRERERPQHTRTAHLDHEGAFLLFVLSCVSSLPRGRGPAQIPEA